MAEGMEARTPGATHILQNFWINKADVTTICDSLAKAQLGQVQIPYPSSLGYRADHLTQSGDANPILEKEQIFGNNIIANIG